MNQAERRDIAIGATRSQIRAVGIDPVNVKAEDALCYLDDIARGEPELVASKWYLQASEKQIVLYRREWERWRRANNA